MVILTLGLLIVEKVAFWKMAWSIERDPLVVLEAIDGIFLRPFSAEVKLLPS